MRFHAERIYRWYIPSYIKNLEQAIVRKSHRRCSMKKCVLKNLAKLQESTCVIVCFLIKLRLIPATSSRKRLWYRCFSVNFAKNLRNFFLQNPSRWLLLRCEHWAFQKISLLIKKFEVRRYFFLNLFFILRKNTSRVLSKFTGVQPGVFLGTGDFLELAHFEKHFDKN